MGQVMIGMGAIPAGKGVGGETGVHQCDSALHGRVTQFGVIPVYLHRHEHALVDYGPGGEAADIPVLINSGTPDLVGCALVDDIEFAIEGLLIRTVKRALQEQLSHHRLAFPGGMPQRGVVGRHVAPAKELHPLLDQDLFQDMTGAVTLGRFRRGKEHADTVVELFGKFDTKRCADRTQEAVRHLHEDTGAVPGVWLTAAGAAVVEIDKNLERLADDLVGLPALYIGDKADAARVVLELRIVKALLCRRSVLFHMGNLCGVYSYATCSQLVRTSYLYSRDRAILKP